MQEKIYHVPVLLNEAVDILLTGYEISSSSVFVDATFGGGGYSKRIIEKLNRNIKVLAIDRDVNVFKYAKDVIDEFGDCLQVVTGNFADIKLILEQNKIEKIDGIVLDLGLSTYQLDYEDGFSYMRDTLLDMRTESGLEVTASDILNKYNRQRLQSVFRNYGELRNYKKITSMILERRIKHRFETTADVVTMLKKKIPQRFLNSELSRVFQALRIEVNNELENLNKCLADSVPLLKPNGRIAVVSYHSLEDRIVKHFFKSSDSLEIITKKPIKASEEEKQNNPRSRSAKLRAAKKV